MLKLSRYPVGGFTLIELLVVVLIIGILAAIALPQYRVSVAKAKFANLELLAKNLADATNRYMLVNNNYPSSFADLDINLSGDYAENNPRSNVVCAKMEKDYCCIQGPSISAGASGSIYCGRNDYSFIFVYGFADSYGNFSYGRHCIAKSDNETSMKLCDNMPHYHVANSAIVTPEGNQLIGHSRFFLD